MNQYNDLKSQLINDAIHNREVMDLLTARHLPRQVMALDTQEATLFNYEYPSYPFVHGLFSGPEHYAQDVMDSIKKSVSDGDTLAELYFLGTRLEFEQIANVVRKLKKELKNLDNLNCFYVKPDVENIRNEVSLSISKRTISEMTELLSEPTQPLENTENPEKYPKIE